MGWGPTHPDSPISLDLKALHLLFSFTSTMDHYHLKAPKAQKGNRNVPNQRKTVGKEKHTGNNEGRKFLIETTEKLAK